LLLLDFVGLLPLFSLQSKLSPPLFFFSFEPLISLFSNFLSLGIHLLAHFIILPLISRLSLLPLKGCNALVLLVDLEALEVLLDLLLIEIVVYANLAHFVSLQDRNALLAKCLLGRYKFALLLGWHKNNLLVEVLLIFEILLRVVLQRFLPDLFMVVLLLIVVVSPIIIARMILLIRVLLVVLVILVRLCSVVVASVFVVVVRLVSASASGPVAASGSFFLVIVASLVGFNLVLSF
jgi:hypothetical protein